MKTSAFDWRSDQFLAIFVIVLWSFGRVINPIVNAVLSNNQPIGPLLGTFELAYIALHGILFVYTLALMERYFKRNSGSRRWRAWGELALYTYVLVTLILSAYFIAYQFGFLPASLEGIIPLGN